MKYKLYSLVRRGESLPFYIGVTTNWGERSKTCQRLYQHKQKYGPHILGSVIAEYPTPEEALFAEAGAIQYWTSQGVVLDNKTEAKTAWNPEARETRRARMMRELAVYLRNR